MALLCHFKPAIGHLSDPNSPHSAEIIHNLVRIVSGEARCQYKDTGLGTIQLANRWTVSDVVTESIHLGVCDKHWKYIGSKRWQLMITFTEYIYEDNPESLAVVCKNVWRFMETELLYNKEKDSYQLIPGGTCLLGYIAMQTGTWVIPFAFCAYAC